MQKYIKMNLVHPPCSAYARIPSGLAWPKRARAVVYHNDGLIIQRRHKVDTNGSDSA